MWAPHTTSPVFVHALAPGEIAWVLRRRQAHLRGTHAQRVYAEAPAGVDEKVQSAGKSADARLPLAGEARGALGPRDSLPQRWPIAVGLSPRSSANWSSSSGRRTITCGTAGLLDCGKTGMLGTSYGRRPHRVF
jgi:hypothetical protein